MSERSARVIDQLPLKLEDLEANATEDELAAEQAAPKQRRSPASNANGRSSVTPTEHLPRKRGDRAADRLPAAARGCVCSKSLSRLS